MTMPRALALATVIVLAIVVLATAWTHLGKLRISIAPTQGPDKPKLARGSDGLGRSEGAFVGSGGWVLSALPDCVTQLSVTHGPPAYVRAHLPAGATIVENGSTLVYGPCTISVRNGEIEIRRGADRLAIPPPAVLYRAGRILALLQVKGANEELRTYAPSSLSESNR